MKIVSKWNYFGDSNMLDYGGKFWRCIGNRQFQFVNLTNMDESCGRDNEGQEKYVVELHFVDLNVISPANIKSALECCGQEANLTDDLLAECCESYGCYALLQSWSGNNGLDLIRQAKREAHELLNVSRLNSALANPVNRIGSTALEAMNGNFMPAIQRGCESGNTDARIMAKMHGATQEVIDCTRPDDWMPYLMGYMHATNGVTKETDPDTSPEYFRGFERGENVKAGKCPAPTWIMD